MFTYLPCMDFYNTAEVLDNRTLCKQFSRNINILHKLILQDYSEPGVKMWAGFERAFYEYNSALEESWQHRIGVELAITKFVAIARKKQFDCAAFELPAWWGDTRVHTSHRSSLIRIFPGHYAKLWPYIPDDLEWYWP